MSMAVHIPKAVLPLSWEQHSYCLNLLCFWSCLLLYFSFLFFLGIKSKTKEGNSSQSQCLSCLEKWAVADNFLSWRREEERQCPAQFLATCRCHLMHLDLLLLSHLLTQCAKRPQFLESQHAMHLRSFYPGPWVSYPRVLCVPIGPSLCHGILLGIPVF